MKGLVLFLLLVLSQMAPAQMAPVQMAAAQTVLVKAGEHPGFTRLVLELPQPVDWQLGRTGDGYDLRLKTDGLRFDLTRVFDTIQRTRLAAIWMDPASGGLRLGVACACHAIPFEFRPGIIVVDVRDGPPPNGSSFELALDGSKPDRLVPRPSPRPRQRPQPAAAPGGPSAAGGPRGPEAGKSSTGAPAPAYSGPGYDWTAARDAVAATKALPGPLPPPLPDPVSHDLGPLKTALLRQLGRGAAQGVVQMAQPSLTARNAGEPLPTGPRANIHFGRMPGFDVVTRRDPDAMLAQDGATCIPDDRLDVAGWAGDLPVSVQIADTRARLLGEFDRPDAGAVAIAARMMIHFGFGAEARQLLEQMPVDHPDAPLWISMAGTVDGAADDAGPFAGMAGCDTAAALWAVAASAKVSLGAPPQTVAVLRAFSALPAHLRRTLGPDLAARFLAAGDIATARTLKSATIRGVVDPTPDIVVMEAGIALAADDPVAAAAYLDPVLTDAGPSTAKAMIALTDARLKAGTPIDGATATALAALVREQAGSALDPALRRAQVLALGASGDFDQAFALLPQMQGAERDLWHLLATLGSDAAVLTHAVLPPDTPVPPLAIADRAGIADHLLTLGLAEAALNWTGAPAADGPDDLKVLAAKANLMLGKADLTLALLDSITDGDGLADLRAAALLQLGKPAEAAEIWAGAGKPDEQLRAQSWAQNWDDLGQGGATIWQPAAALTSGPIADAAIPEANADASGPLAPNPDAPNPPAPGPLAKGAALVADSVATRATLAALLENVPRPDPGE